MLRFHFCCLFCFPNGDIAVALSAAATRTTAPRCVPWTRSPPCYRGKKSSWLPNTRRLPATSLDCGLGSRSINPPLGCLAPLRRLVLDVSLHERPHILERLLAEGSCEAVSRGDASVAAHPVHSRVFIKREPAPAPTNHTTAKTLLLFALDVEMLHDLDGFAQLSPHVAHRRQRPAHIRVPHERSELREDRRVLVLHRRRR